MTSNGEHGDERTAKAARVGLQGAGGVGGGAHTLQEWFRPEGRDLGLKRIFLLMLLLLAPQLPEPGSDGR